jgi:hypothetical protein
MAKSRKPLLGHISFRLSPGRHQELLEIARHLGIDLSSLLNQMIGESLPAFLERATDVVRRQEAARREFNEISIPLSGGDSPLVQVALEAGRDKKGVKRVNAMIAAVGPRLKPKDGSLARIVLKATEVLEKEEEARQIEEGVRRFYEQAEPPGDEPEPGY